MLHRLRLPLLLTAASFRCHQPYDSFGDHLAACPRTVAPLGVHSSERLPEHAGRRAQLPRCMSLCVISSPCPPRTRDEWKSFFEHFRTAWWRPTTSATGSNLALNGKVCVVATAICTQATRGCNHSTVVYDKVMPARACSRQTVGERHASGAQLRHANSFQAESWHECHPLEAVGAGWMAAHRIFEPFTSANGK